MPKQCLRTSIGARGSRCHERRKRRCAADPTRCSRERTRRATHGASGLIIEGLVTSRSDQLTISAAAALYDSMLQRALQQFFSRAVLETEVVPSQAGSSAMAIEPTVDATAIVVTWFEFRHSLKVPPDRPFTPDEVRFARAIVSVLDARYRAIFDPSLMAERLDLFRGAVEDRYIGAFLDDVPYTLEHVGRADVIAQAIEVLRVAALSRYENREISSGVLLLDSDVDPARGACGVTPTLDYAE